MASPHPEPVARQLEMIARQMIDVAQRASRPDLAERLEQARQDLDNVGVRVVVVGQFKQGKSALVNALVSAPVCPVDDVIATSVPTVVRWGEQATATLVTELSGERQAIRTAIDPGELRAHVTELAGDSGIFGTLHADVALPRRLLAGGLTLIDTPGFGRAQVRASSNLALLPQADALVMVSDATQELTEPELVFLRQASELCSRLTFVVSKSDLQHDWRNIVAADTEHLAAVGIDVPLLVTSSLMHELAVQQRDNELIEEAGIHTLAKHLHRVHADVLAERHRAIASEIHTVGELLAMVFSTELEVIGNPENGEEIIQDLRQAEETAERLTLHSARWQQTLADGTSELIDDIEFDLRDRLRQVGREAEQLIDSSDPGRSWEDTGTWLAESVTQAVSDNFVWAHTRSMHLADVVSKHFVLEGRSSVPDLSLPSTERALRAIGDLDYVRSGSLSAGQKLMIGLKGSYGGVLMFGLMTTLAGMALVNPISVVAGLIMGGFAYKQDAKQRLEQRRAEAKVAVRKLIDEAIFQVSKESRDRLNTVKRVLRDHFVSVAEHFKQSLAESIRSAKRSAALPPSERSVRAAAVASELRALRALGDRAMEVGAPSPTRAAASAGPVTAVPVTAASTPAAPDPALAAPTPESVRSAR